MATTSPEKRQFTCPIQIKQLKKTFPDFHKDDIILIAHTDGTRIGANRAILAASSRCMSYILTTLSEDYLAQIKIPNVNGGDLKSIWNFMRTADIEFDSENVKRILMAADFFRLNSLVKACEDFLQKLVDDSNCLDVFAIAHKYDMSQLTRHCLVYAHYHDIHTKKAFFRLNKQQLETYLLNAERLSNVQLYYCLIDWYRHDKKNRWNIMNSLMSEYVDFLELKGRCIAMDWNIAHELPVIRKAKILLVYCHPDKVPDLFVQTYDTEREAWSYESWLAHSSWKTESTKFLIDKRMFVSGGRDESRVYNCVSYFDIEDEEFNELKPMLTARSGHSMVEIDGNLYVVGGVDSGGKLVSSIERYDPPNQTWTAVTKLPDGFDCCQASAARGGLYVGTPKMNCLACYDSNAKTWTWTPTMPSSMPGEFNMTTVKACIYVVGMDASYQYNTIKKKWEEMTLGTTKACTAWNDHLLLFRLNYKPKFHMFDPECPKKLTEILAFADKRRDKGLKVSAYISVYQ